MNCPKCGYCKVGVSDSMPGTDGLSIYRRRKCPNCKYKFRTIEVIDDGSKAFQEGYLAAVEKKSPFYKADNDRRRLCNSSK